MEKIFLLATLLIVSNVSNSQKHTYRDHINKAELAIVDSKFDSALLFYKDAFYKNKYGLGKDYFNAAQCAIKEKQFTDAKSFLLTLYQRGYALFDSMKLKKLQTQVDTDFISDLKKKAEKIKVNTYDYEGLRTQLEEMNEKDQYYRRKNPRDYVHKADSSTIKTIDSINAYKMVAIFKKYGVPTEFMIGYAFNGKVLISNINWEIILLHQRYDTPFRVVDFSEYLLPEIKNEKLPSHTIFRLYRTTLSNDPSPVWGHYHLYKVEDDKGSYRYAYTKQDSMTEISINKTRLANGLETVADFRKKIIFYATANKDFLFDFQFGEDVVSIPKYIADKVAEQTTLIYIDKK